MKKLFKKIAKLEDDLKESESERIRLKLELEAYVGRTKLNTENDKTIAKLEGEKYRLEVDLGLFKRLLSERE